MEVKCLISDSEDRSWEEELPVKSLETAERDINIIIDSFNSDLRPGELPRRLIKVLKVKTVEEKTIGDVFKDIELVLRDLRHEVSNAYGSAWLKANNNYRFRMVMKSYDKMIETGKSKSFKNALTEIFNNVRDIQNIDDLKYLSTYDFDNKLKGAQ